ncbi:hypothetical protein [Mycolicibacterium neoaurum]|nr:hypothetical protein [Mycolicibacterium neoaurum]
MAGEEAHELDRDADAPSTRIGHRLGQPVFTGGLAHSSQHLPVRESANQGGVLGGQFGDDVFDPGQHPFDADVERFQDTDRDEKTAKVVVGTIRGQGAEGVVADVDRAASHLPEKLGADARFLAQPPQPCLWAFGVHQLVEDRPQLAVNLAGRRVGEQVAEAFTQEASRAPIVPVGMVFAPAFAAPEDRLDTGT